MTAYTQLQKFLLGKNARTRRAGKNIYASLAIKGGSMLVTFAAVPLSLEYISQEKYGVWITLSSIIAWINFFDVGLGNGLKNKLAQALANNNLQLGKIYISTAYAILASLIVIVALIFLVVNSWIDWTAVLNTEKSLSNELQQLALIVFNLFFIQFIFQLVRTVLHADQRSAIGNSFGPLGSLISLIILFILIRTTEGSLIYLGIAYGLPPVLVLMLASMYLYKRDYKRIAPSLKAVDFSHARTLLSLGVKFFIIQISMLVLFQSSNIMIAQIFGPMDVASFSIAFKYFSVIGMLFSIIVMPFWSAFTEAWEKKDINWMKQSIKNLFYLWIGFVFLGLCLVLFSDLIFQLWLGKEKLTTIEITLALKICLFLYFASFTFGGIFTVVINGLGKILLQTYCSIVGALLFVPLALFFAKIVGLGLESVVVASILANFYAFIAPVHCFKLINNKATGIWNR